MQRRERAEDVRHRIASWVNGHAAVFADGAEELGSNCEVRLAPGARAAAEDRTRRAGEACKGLYGEADRESFCNEKHVRPVVCPKAELRGTPHRRHASDEETACAPLVYLSSYVCGRCSLCDRMYTAGYMSQARDGDVAERLLESQLGSFKSNCIDHQLMSESLELQFELLSANDLDAAYEIEREGNLPVTLYKLPNSHHHVPSQDSRPQRLPLWKGCGASGVANMPLGRSLNLYKAIGSRQHPILS
jgi:hypothetical protein